MPLPPLPDNNTVRAWIDYSGVGGDHSLMLRFQPGAGTSFVQSQLQTLSGLLAPLWYPSTTTQGFRMSEAGSTVSFDLGGSAVTGTAGGVLDELLAPRFISFVGRSRLGRRVRYFIYQTAFVAESDYRLEIGDFPAADTVRAWLDDPANFLVAKDNEAAALKPYINWGFNSYHQRKRRTVI